MTREDIVKGFKNAIANNSVFKIKHNNMRTVEFYVTGEEESVYQKFMGWWICLQTGEPVVQDTIKIKKEDLKDWKIV